MSFGLRCVVDRDVDVPEASDKVGVGFDFATWFLASCFHSLAGHVHHVATEIKRAGQRADYILDFGASARAERHGNRKYFNFFGATRHSPVLAGEHGPFF